MSRLARRLSRSRLLLLPRLLRPLVYPHPPTTTPAATTSFSTISGNFGASISASTLSSSSYDRFWDYYCYGCQYDHHRRFCASRRRCCRSTMTTTTITTVMTTTTTAPTATTATVLRRLQHRLQLRRRQRLRLLLRLRPHSPRTNYELGPLVYPLHTTQY